MDYKKNPWPMMLSFLFICLSLNNHLSLGADTISADQPLSGDQTISSNGGNFELGFFTPGNSSRSNYYIGMWYKKVSLRTIVWVANRKTPVSDRSSSVLRISNDSAAIMVGHYPAVEFVLVSTEDTIICNQQSMPFCNCLKYFQPTSDKSWNLSDFSAGCARKTSLQCGNDTLANGKRDRFWEMPNMKLPDHPQTVAVGSSSECESTCLNNCSCTAYTYGDHCSIWIGDLLNLQQLTSADTNGGTLYLKLAASELLSSKNGKTITAGFVLGSVAGIAIFAGLPKVAVCIFNGGISSNSEIMYLLWAYHFQYNY
ncbi:g-type lectin s-receptor-like serine/threonine-protein kinase [Quercus suber]|uniref:G-type lectin s-receptor-like serine/threonine-protein kinase n=1 Tax=Quercus suber TaxID=58331 RepID=A0AAW0KWB9_QUESU